jgi:hypothetical protein
LEDDVTTAKRNRALVALESLARPAASKELIPLTGLNGQTVYRYMRRLVEENKAYVAYTKIPDRGGPAENFYLPGPMPAGYEATRKAASEEELKRRAAARKAKALVYSREFKRRKRLIFTPKPSPLSEPFEQLEGVWYSIFKGENHATSA